VRALLFLRRYGAELLTAAALLAGWLLITWGVASLVGWRAWPFSLGTLCLSCAGWRLLVTIARDGLYALTRSPHGP
jgi:hypothetical protein